MSRSGLLFAAGILLAGCLLATADPPAPVKNPSAVDHLIGHWKITFANGVIETCSVCSDEKMSVVEPNRSRVAFLAAEAAAPKGVSA